MSASPNAVPGILIASQIRQEMAQGRLVKGGEDRQVRGCSYDLRVGTIFWENKVYSGSDLPVVVPPGGVVAIMTKESLALPNDVCATAFAINQLSSKGFLVLNPGHVDPGFEGVLTVKALNVRKVDMPLPIGANIFTVIFQRLPEETTPFEHNNPDPDARLREFYAVTVETSPRTFFEVMKAERDGPFPSRDEVDKMIQRHWSSWIAMGLSAATLILAAVAAYKAIYPSATTQGIARPEVALTLPSAAPVPIETPQYGPTTEATVTLPSVKPAPTPIDSQRADTPSDAAAPANVE